MALKPSEPPHQLVDAFQPKAPRPGMSGAQTGCQPDDSHHRDEARRLNALVPIPSLSLPRVVGVGPDVGDAPPVADGSGQCDPDVPHGVAVHGDGRNQLEPARSHRRYKCRLPDLSSDEFVCVTCLAARPKALRVQDPSVHVLDRIVRIFERHVVADELGLEAPVLPPCDEVVGAGDLRAAQG